MPTARESVLISVITITLTASVVMAVLIGYIIPKEWATADTEIPGLTRTCVCNFSSMGLRLLDKSKCEYRRHIIRTVTKPETFSLWDSFMTVEKYPEIVSLTVPAYIDDSRERRYACTGVILNKHWVLTGTGCVYEDSEFITLVVRAGSNLWSKGGTLHSVTSFNQSEVPGVVALQVSPPFPDHLVETVLPKVNINLSESDWLDTISVGWYRQASNQFFNRYKLNSMSSEKLVREMRNCLNCSEGAPVVEPNGTKQIECNDMATGRALFAFPHTFIGINTGYECERIKKQSFMKLKYTALNQRSIMAWMQQLTIPTTVAVSNTSKAPQS